MLPIINPIIKKKNTNFEKQHCKNLFTDKCIKRNPIKWQKLQLAGSAEAQKYIISTINILHFM